MRGKGRGERGEGRGERGEGRGEGREENVLVYSLREWKGEEEKKKNKGYTYFVNDVDFKRRVIEIG